MRSTIMYQLMRIEKRNFLINKNPKGERKLPYEVVSYIKRNFPQVTISVGVGKHHSTTYARLESDYKGYTRGRPDVELKCKVGDDTDVVAIDLKTPNGTNWLSIEQESY